MCPFVPLCLTKRNFAITMRHIAYIFFLALLLVSCGTDGAHFKFEGRLLNLNQGQFFVYSPDGGIDGMDTIKVEGGRFTYEMPCDKASTLIIVFPNFSEHPVFARPGEVVEIDGDASHLKEIKVTGTDENELLTGFREQVASFSPPEVIKEAARFIKDNPSSIVSTYLVRRYFISDENSDYKQALSLINLMMGSQPDNGYLVRMAQQVKPLAVSMVGSPLPAFSGYGINGERVDNSSLKNASVGVINVWASWNQESMNMQRQLKTIEKTSNGKLKVISICVDASKYNCRNYLKRDSVAWPTVCDEEMFDGTIIKTLGLMQMPDNIVLRNGRIVARGLNEKDLMDKLKSLI